MFGGNKENAGIQNPQFLQIRSHIKYHQYSVCAYMMLLPGFDIIRHSIQPLKMFIRSLSVAVEGRLATCNLGEG